MASRRAPSQPPGGFGWAGGAAGVWERGAGAGFGVGGGGAGVTDLVLGAADAEEVGDQVATGAGDLRLVEVQPASRSRMATSAWLTGARPVAGERLGG